MNPSEFTPKQWLAVAVAGFVVYNSTVIVWELGKPGSRECKKCAFTRISLGAALGAFALADAFLRSEA